MTLRKLPVQALRLAPIVIGIFAGCTGSGNSPQTPSSRQALCERYLAVLSGRVKDDRLLDNPEIQKLGVGAPDLVMCGAVMSDSSTLCKRLFPQEHGPSGACLHMESIFHELRANPNSRTFLFSENDWKDCRQLHPKECDALRVAIRSGDEKACASAGDLEPMCHAFLNLDPSLCRFSPEAERRLTAGAKPGQKIEAVCKEAVSGRKFLAQGLQVLAESGPPRERALAKAALRQPDACTAYEQPVMEACLGNPGALGQVPPVGQPPALPASQTP